MGLYYIKLILFSTFAILFSTEDSEQVKRSFIIDLQGIVALFVNLKFYVILFPIISVIPISAILLGITKHTFRPYL
jgi:hypothetical protein